MWSILLFRIVVVLGFVLSAWRWGDLRNWHRYYPTLLFIMVVNLSAAFITYHHQLWVFKPDALVSTETVVELVNSYIILPATALLYLANYPKNGIVNEAVYILWWVLGYFALEFIDAHYIGGIAYAHGWCCYYSLLFDFAMFSILRIHHLKPLFAWLITFIMAFFIMYNFGILSTEMK